VKLELAAPQLLAKQAADLMNITRGTALTHNQHCTNARTSQSSHTTPRTAPVLALYHTKTSS
jgi:hypothetical protein